MSKKMTITPNNMFHVPVMKKNLFSVANAIDSGNYMLFGLHDVKFLWNLKMLKAIVVTLARKLTTFLSYLLLYLILRR